jgi:hypothetical protein
MEPVEFKKAYYIKLGRGGECEQSSISESKLRIGWKGQDIRDINQKNWEKIRQQLAKGSKQNKGQLTRDWNAVREISESTSEDLWIAFSQNAMWWGKLSSQEMFQDDKSKYRLVSGNWSNEDAKFEGLGSVNCIVAKSAHSYLT